MPFFRDVPRWIFLGTLFYAPWAYGTTTAATIVGLDYLLGAVAVLWVVELTWRRRMPAIPRPLLCVTALLLSLGWGMAVNAKAFYDSDLHFFYPLRPLLAALPGSFDAPNSVAYMCRLTGLLVACCFAADLVQRPVWLTRLWVALGLAGGSIALLGLIEKGSGARMIFWGEWLAQEPPTFFATYFYHANAGAYLNLVLPLTVGLAVRSIVINQPPALRALWGVAALSTTVAVFANTSRGAQVIGIGAMLFLGGFLQKEMRGAIKRAEKPAIVVAAGVIILVILAVAQASRLDQPLKRWGQLSAQVSSDQRWAAAKTAVPIALRAGAFGFGPATFRSVFPHYANAPGSIAQGQWRFLHEDYLQTLIEWGWLGSALWGFWFFGGMLTAFVARRQFGSGWLSRQRMLIPLVLLALATVALHGLVDFPLQIASIQLYVAVLVGICWGAKGWKSEVGSRKSEVGSLKSEVGSRKSEV